MRAPRNELIFVPLGGSGEIGMNLNVYGHDGRWLIVDCGITFSTFGGRTDLLMPDPRFIARRRDTLLGIVVTHAHEDHLGAIPHLWRELQCPVYATPFPAAILRRKLQDLELEDEVPLHEIPLSGTLSLPPFDLRFVNVTHSTVESSALILETPCGTVVHTGDFKLDPDPLIGPLTDVETLQAVGRKGVLAVISDSTNAPHAGASRSEAELRAHLLPRFDHIRTRIATACFASNIARIATLAEAARRLDRHPIIVGRSLHRMIAAARRLDYLPPFDDEVSTRDFGYLPPEKVFLICTGTQAEPGAALSRIAQGDHPDIALERNDLVLFSSKIIPGNEEPIGHLHTRLRRRGLHVVSEREEFVHVSGHPPQDDLRQLYAWLSPRIVIPVHGEERHMEAHAELAGRCGAQSLVPFNGAVVRLAPGPAEIIDRVPAGRLLVPQTDVPSRDQKQHPRAARRERPRTGRAPQGRRRSRAR